MHIPRHQKTYLSRAMTRAMALDHPIGDPHGGPAYGERNDPVSAVISIGTMLATGGAVMAGTASLMTGLAFAGAALSLVGNVSGNKSLTKIGMFVGLAGGVGSLAESAGMFSSGTMGETFGYGAEAAGTGAAPANALAQTPTNELAQAAQAPAAVADTGGGGLISEAAGFNPASQLNPSPVAGLETGSIAPGSPAANLTSNLVGSGAQAPVSAGIDPSLTPVANGAPAAPGAPGAPAAPAAPSAPGVPTTADMLKTANASTDPIGSMWQQTGGAVDPSYAGNIRPMTGMESAWTGIKDIGSEFMNLAKSNPGAAYMLGSGISSVADVVSGKAGAQVDALEAQGQLSKAQADKLRFEMDEYKRKLAQRNSNYANVQNPLATWKPNFQTSMTPQPGTGGLIGGAMQPATGG